MQKGIEKTVTFLGLEFYLAKSKYSYVCMLPEAKLSTDKDFKYFILYKKKAAKKHTTIDFSSSEEFTTVYRGEIPTKEFLNQLLSYSG
jgi:hypothetical protein